MDSGLFNDLFQRIFKFQLQRYHPKSEQNFIFHPRIVQRRLSFSVLSLATTHYVQMWRFEGFTMASFMFGVEEQNVVAHERRLEPGCGMILEAAIDSAPVSFHLSSLLSI